jgi:hypothetical protein
VLVAGVKWRLGVSLAVFAVAALAYASAIIGPSFLRSAKSAILSHVVSAASPTATQLQIVPNELSDGQVPAGQSAHATMDRVVSRIEESGASRWFDHTIITSSAGIVINLAHPSIRVIGTLLARSHECAHLVMRQGSCARLGSGILVSTRTASLLGLHLGSHVPLQVLTVGKANVTVRGIYELPNPQAPYWGGVNYFSYGSVENHTPEIDAAIMTEGSLARLSGRATVVSAQLSLRSGSVHLSNTAALLEDLTTWRSEAIHVGNVSLGTTLDAVIARSAAPFDIVTQDIEIGGFEVAALALLVLYTLVSRTARERQGEASLALLKGFRRGAVLSAAALEPLTLVTLSLPAGVIIGLGVAWAAGSVLFPRGTPVGVDGEFFLALALVYVGALTAVISGSQVLLSARGHRHLGSVVGTRAQRLRTLVFDSVVGGVALAGIVEVVNVGVSRANHLSILGALAPLFVAVAFATIGVRLLPLALALLRRWTQRSRHLALFLATRSLTRRAGLLRSIILVTLATSIGVFSLVSWDVANHNRKIQAAFELGAAHVLTVSLPSDLTLTQAVDHVDPRGHVAMAAVIERSASGRLLALQASRIPSVLDWPASLGAGSAALLARRIAPKVAPPLVLSNARAVALTVSVARVPSDSAVALQVLGFNETTQQGIFTQSSPLRVGTHTYVMSFDGQCSTRCRITALGPIALTNSTLAPFTQRIDFKLFASIGQDRRATSSLGLFQSLRRWRGFGGTTLRSVKGRGIVGTFESVSNVLEAEMQVVDVPNLVPTVMTQDLASISDASLGGGEVSLTGLDGNSLNARLVGTAPVLPNLGEDSALVDLTFAERSQTAPQLGAVDEVWTNERDDTSLVAALERERVRVISASSALTLAHNLGGDGPGFGDDFYVISAILALVLVFGSTSFSMVNDLRRRAIEATDLVAIGLTRSVVARALWIESMVIAVAGVALGGLAAVLAARISLSSIPEFVHLEPGPRLSYGLPVGVIAGVALAELAALTVAVFIGSALTLRRARPDLLRVSGQ